MTISELIRALEEVQEEYGDINVTTEFGEFEHIIVDYFTENDNERSAILV